jgi:hypothetical protein
MYYSKWRIIVYAEKLRTGVNGCPQYSLFYFYFPHSYSAWLRIIANG